MRWLRASLVEEKGWEKRNYVRKVPAIEESPAGRDTLAGSGPEKPVGLKDPRTGRIHVCAGCNARQANLRPILQSGRLSKPSELGRAGGGCDGRGSGTGAARFRVDDKFIATHTSFLRCALPTVQMRIIEVLFCGGKSGGVEGER